MLLVLLRLDSPHPPTRVGALGQTRRLLVPGTVRQSCLPTYYWPCHHWWI